MVEGGFEPWALRTDTYGRSMPTKSVCYLSARGDVENLPSRLRLSRRPFRGGPRLAAQLASQRARLDQPGGQARSAVQALDFNLDIVPESQSI